MLIIAIPKSVSTALLKTLGKLHDLPNRQIFFKDYEPPTEMELLWKYHSDIREIGPAEVERFYEDGALFKQHLPPTENNVERLAGRKKVILLRDPEEIVRAYFRAEQSKIHDPRPEFTGCRNEQEWMQRAEELGLLKDLRFFYDRWIERAPEALVVQSEDLIRNPLETINEIEQYLGLNVSPPPISLVKARYSRGGKFQSLLEKAEKMAKKVYAKLRALRN